MDKKYFQLQISPLWSIISDVKKKVSEMLANQSQGIIDFSIIVISELMENAIKYGVANEALPHVAVEFSIDNGLIKIAVRNGIKNDAHIVDLVRIMDKIIYSENKEELYLMRMHEILENPEAGGSQLGLYRIVSEAKFDLSYKVENNVVEILATKTTK
jgi:hypothetical protein